MTLRQCINISIDGVCEFSDDMSAFAKSLHNIDDIYRSLSFTHMSDYIKGIIGFGSDFHFTSKPSDEKNDIYIYPALDDRMFVACEYISKEFSDAVVSKKNDKYASKFARVVGKLRQAK